MPAGLIALVVMVGLSAAGPARAADGLWDTMLEMLDVKPAPAAPAPGFVQRTRPDPAGLGYFPPAVPHKVSPLPVKSADEIEAKKNALDAAKDRQLNPPAPVPLQVAKAKKPGAAKAGPGVTD